MSYKLSDIAVVICVFMPQLDNLEEKIEYYCAHGVECVVVFNDDSHKYVADRKFLNKIILGDNLGVAAAFNRGLEYVALIGCKVAALLDQDSKLIVSDILQLAEDINEHVFLVGPQFLDTVSGRLSGHFSDSNTYPRIYHSNDKVFCFQVISSGSIVNLDLVADVGLMDEALFIDWVDFEWCWRARALGYKIVGRFDVVMTHALGDDIISFGSLSYRRRSQVRYYYILRNGFYLAFYNDKLTLRQRLGLLRKIIMYFFAYTIDLLSQGKIFSSVMLLKSVIHAILKRLGKFY